MVLTIPREIFMKTVGELRKKVNYHRLEILMKVPLFQGWQISRLSALYKHFIKLEFGYKETVYKEGCEDDRIYVIMKGEVEVPISSPRSCPTGRLRFLCRTARRTIRLQCSFRRP